MTQSDPVRISNDKTDLVLGMLLSVAEGPREAYGILCTCIYRLNFEFMEENVSIDELGEEVRQTLLSITRHTNS